MAQALKTSEGRVALKSYLMTKMEDGIALNSTEISMLIAIENIERDNGI